MVRQHAFVALAMIAIGTQLPAQISQQAGDATPSIVGVWRIAEVSSLGPNGIQVANTQPGLRIYTRKHYSVTVVPNKDSFAGPTGQIGTYEVNGDEIIHRAFAAVTPDSMRSDHFLVSSLAFVDRDTVWIVHKRNDAGPMENPSNWKLTRVE